MKTFLITGGVFGAMSLYGFVTKRDLTTMGSYLTMAVIGLFLASLVNIFWANNALSWIITYAVLAVFIGLTAYQTQNLKNMAEHRQAECDMLCSPRLKQVLKQKGIELVGYDTLREKFVTRMQQPGTLKNGKPIANGYGMGLGQGTYRGVPTVSHGGALAGYRTNFLRLPGEKLTVVTLCNNATANAGRLTQMVAELYAPDGMSAPAAVPAPAPAPPQAPTQTAIPRELGQALAGVYYSAELEATYRIVAGSDAVTLEMGNNGPVALRLTGPDLLRTPQGLELKLVRDGGSRITGLTIGAGRVRDLAFTKR